MDRKAVHPPINSSNSKQGGFPNVAKKIYTIFAVALFVSFGLLLTPKPSTAATVTLKVSHQFAAGDVRDLMAHAFGDMVTQKTNGEIKFRYYPAKSLFKPKEQWDAMRNGALDCRSCPWIMFQERFPNWPSR